MKTLFTLVAVLVMWRLAIPLVVLHRLLRLRVWRTRARPVPNEEVPPHVRDGLRAPITELETLGFELLGWTVLEREALPQVAPRFYARLFQAEAGAYAGVGFSNAPERVAPWQITFSTSGGTGGEVRTFDGGEQSPLGEPPGTIVVAPYEAATSQQWERHRASVRDAKIIPMSLDHEAAFESSQDRRLAFFDSLVRDGHLLPAEASSYVYSWPAALHGTRAVLSGLPRLKRQRAQREAMRRASLQPFPGVPVEEEAVAYEKQVEDISARPRASFLAGLFAMTLLLFVGAGWYAIGTAATAALVMGIVLFHEFGHYTAMRALGYVDTTIFFVPFLGGIAAGRNDEATVAQRMIVLLAGPVPGLLLVASAILIHPPSGVWLRKALVFVAIINLFNLLPILPLDGGQMAHMLVFARRPRLDVLSRAVAGLGLIAIWQVFSAVFLGALGVITLVQLPKSWHQATLRRQFREARLARPEEPPVRLFFRVLGTTPLADAPFAQKVALARSTFGLAMVDAPMRGSAQLAGLSAYASAFVLGTVAVVLSLGASAHAGVAAPGPAHVEVVAALACPAPLAASSDVAAPYLAFGGIGVFATTDALANAATRLKAVGGNVVLRSVGPALFVWAQSNDDEPGEIDDWDPLSEASPRHTEGIGAPVRAAGGHFYDLESVTPAIECIAPDEPAARSVGDALDDYLVLERNSMPIAVPWNSRDEPTDAQRLARRTFRIASTARDAVRMEPPPLHWWWHLSPSQLSTFAAERRAKELDALERALTIERAARPIDEDVARLVRAKTVGPPGEWRQIDDQLRERLGATSSRDPTRAAFGMKASRAGARVRVTFDHLRPPQYDFAVRPLLSWLCARSCENARLVLETQ